MASKQKMPATTDELGHYITAALANMADGYINAHLPAALPVPGGQPEPGCDEIEAFDPADPSNIRINTVRGGFFVVRIIREG